MNQDFFEIESTKTCIDLYALVVVTMLDIDVMARLGPKQNLHSNECGLIFLILKVNGL